MSNTENSDPHESPEGPPALGELSRRDWIKAAGIGLGIAVTAKVAHPIFDKATDQSPREFLQKHYKELDASERAEVISRLETEAAEKSGVRVKIKDPPPIPGTKFGYAINLSKCNGNGECMRACHKENNHDRDTNQSYIRILEMEQGSMDLEKGNTTYTHTVPAPGKFYLPVQCQQCDNPPCVKVCPVEATWKEPDGIVVVDYNWCIGCRYCEAACPYHARRFNWKEPTIPPEEINPDQGYLSNRVRPQGVMEKCHFCLHRTREGKLPACLEACSTGARVFGNLLDESSDIRWILANKRIWILKEEVGTKPSFFYFFDA